MRPRAPPRDAGALSAREIVPLVLAPRGDRALADVRLPPCALGHDVHELDDPLARRPDGRDDERGHLLEEPYACAFLTAPAPNKKVVADAFATALAGPFADAFEEVVFAVLDWSEERRFVRPFVERFAS